jgi:hypothetical protein
MLNNFARSLLTLILSVVLVGFGVCGAYGTFGGLTGLFGHPGQWGAAFTLTGLGLVGLGVAWICWMAIAGLWRKRPPTDE